MPARVVVVGLGPAGPEHVTEAARAALERITHRFVRTERHPTTVPGAVSFDSLYERHETLEGVYAGIVGTLVEAAEEHGEVVYAVPGSPLVAERTVELLRDAAAAGRVEVAILPAVSFLDLAWSRLDIDPVAAGVRVVDGHRFAVEAAGERGPMLVAQCDSRAVLSDIKLAAEGKSAVVLRHLGLDDESVWEVAWAELDHASAVEADHLTSVWIPSLAAPVAGEVVRFAELVRTLRARCPWDREQTHQTLTRHLIEETYEVLDAIESGDAAHLEEELGDLLFQVVFHATLAAEEGEFTLADVARGVHDKLVGRHPHVFGDVQAETASQVMRNWEHIKQAEKGRQSLMEGIPSHLPSLLYAHKVQRKAASVGLDVVPDGGDIGDRLYRVVRDARIAGVDPETALRATVTRLLQRFEAFEKLAAERGVDLAAAGPGAVAELWGDLWTEAADGSG